MTDENAPVRRHLGTARERLAGVRERREGAQALTAFWQAAHARNAAQEPATPIPEATP